MKRIVYILLFLFAWSNAQTVTGELRKWHTITIEFTDDETYTETGTPDPFQDRRLNVTFTSPGSVVWVVPGYFAADGNAAETSATSGDKWHVKFTPNEIGTWSYSASFREGIDVAVTYPSSASDGSASTGIDGQSGSFTIINTNKGGTDLRGKGRLNYDGTGYPKFEETGEAFIKVGPDSPEDLLAYTDFDGTVFSGGTDFRSSYANHEIDFEVGDPTWQGGNGSEIMGVINYLESEGLNSISFLPMNRPFGDAKDVSPWVETANGVDPADNTAYDVSKLAQWEIFFEHAQSKGFFLHFKTHEEENIAYLGGNAGITGNTPRKLYYRELIARFGHHLALNWNVSEESEGLPASSSHAGTATVAEHIEVFQYLADIDPYDHPRVIHTKNSSTEQNATYDLLYGGLSEATGASVQSLTQFAPRDSKRIVENAKAAGQAWLVSHDETGGGIEDTQLFRQRKLYGVYFAGAYGAEMFRSGSNVDFTLDDFRSGDLDVSWDYCRYAREFMLTIPFEDMVGLPSNTFQNPPHTMQQDDVIYVKYYADASGGNDIDLGSSGDTFDIEWYDPRNGGNRQIGTVGTVVATAGDNAIGNPPNSTTSDWVVVVTNQNAFPNEAGIVPTTAYLATANNAATQIVKAVIATSGNTVSTIWDTTSSATLLHDEDFELLAEAATTGFDGWNNVTTDTAGRDWQVETEGDTPTSDTGPGTGGSTSISNGAQLASSAYAYTETTSGGATDEFYLESVLLDASTIDPYLRFRYINYWNDNLIGDFFVDVWDGTAWQREFLQTGQHPDYTTGNQFTDWRLVEVDASSYTNSDLQFRIGMSKNNPSPIFRHDTGIDNIQIWNGNPN